EDESSKASWLLPFYRSGSHRLRFFVLQRRRRAIGSSWLNRFRFFVCFWHQWLLFWASYSMAISQCVFLRHRVLWNLLGIHRASTRKRRSQCTSRRRRSTCKLSGSLDLSKISNKPGSEILDYWFVGFCS